MVEAILDPLAPILSVLENVRRSGNGYSASCPCHSPDKKPSLSVSLADDGITPLVRCHTGCSQDAVIKALKQMGAWPEKAAPNPTRIRRSGETIPAEVVEKAHKALNDEQRRYLKEERQLSDQVIDRYRIGVLNGRVTIPIVDDAGRIVDIRRWLIPEKRKKGDAKILPWRKGYGAPRFFPIDQLQHDSLLSLEGEMDTLAAISAGLPAVTVTAGAGTWPEELSREFQGKQVTILMDNDKAGRDGAQKRAHSLSRYGCSVAIAEWPKRPEGWDITDELKEYGVESLKGILKSAQIYRGPLVRLSDVQAEKVEFLFHPLVHIPIGKITMIDGDPGIGKTYVTQAFAAALSLGKGVPGMDERKPAPALLLNGEDGLEDTIKPRLEGLEADCRLVMAITEPLSFDKEEDLNRFESYIRACQPALVVIDPLSVYLGSKVDAFRDNQVRPILSRLATLAGRHDCAILCVRHLTKGSKVKAIYRGQGSIGFIAAARSGLLVGADPNDKSKGAIFHVKHNLSEQGKPIGYEIREGRFFWTGESTLTENEVLGEQDDGERLKIEEAVEFLESFLAQGPILAKKVIPAASKEGISKRTLYRAKSKLKVKPKRLQFQGPVYWALTDGNHCAEAATEIAKDGNHCETRQNEPSPRTQNSLGNLRDSNHCKDKNNNNLSILAKDGNHCGNHCGNDSAWQPMEKSSDCQPENVAKTGQHEQCILPDGEGDKGIDTPPNHEKEMSSNVQ